MAMPSQRVLVERREREKLREGVTVKALAVGFALVVGITVAGCFSAFLRYDLIGTGHLPRCALFPVMMLVLLNAVSRWLFGKALFSRTELLFIYCIVLIMTGIPGQQYADYLYLGLVAPVYFANPRNMPELLQYEGVNWLPHIPSWLVPTKEPRSGVVTWVLEGMPEGGNIPWQPWVLPLAVWTVFFVALFTAHIGIAALLRRQWVENEKLTFPLAQVPIEVADERRMGMMASNPLLWFGFFIPVFIYILRALHIYYPYFPGINIYPNWGALFQSRPWDVLNYMPFNLYFDMIGITYFVATDVGFSFWFFWVARRLQMVVRSAMGLGDHQQPLEQQSIGGLFALSVMQAYIARHYFKEVMRQAWRGNNDADAAPLPYRHLLLLLILSVGGVLLWSVLGAGLSLRWAILLFLVHFIWRIMQARMVAEAGLFVFWTPIPITNFFMRVFGRDLVGAKDIVAMNMIGSKISDSATDLMPQALQGLKIAQSEGLNQKQVFWLMMASMLISVLVCHPTSLHIIYTTSVPKMGWWMQGYPRSVANTMLTHLAQDLRMPTAHYIHLTAGGLVTMVLTWLRWRFLWFPFHPLGYAASNAVSWFGDRYGFSIFLGWLAKALVMWFGGIRLWHFFKPFMLGLILGNTFILFLLLIIHFFFPTNEVVVIE